MIYTVGEKGWIIGSVTCSNNAQHAAYSCAYISANITSYNAGSSDTSLTINGRINTGRSRSIIKHQSI